MKINNRIHEYLASGRSWYQRDVSKIKIITVHHDAIPHKNQSANTVLNQIYEIHHDQKKWPGVSYHFYIHTDGEIYQLNNHTDITWHDKVNSDSIGIVLHGYFHSAVNNDPTKEQLNSLKWLLDELSTKHPEFPADKDDIRGHRERSSTACPGDRLFPFIVEYRNQQGSKESENMNIAENELFEKLVHNSTLADQVVKKLEIADKADNVSFETIDRSINARVGNSESLKSKLAVAEQEIINRKQQIGRTEEDLRNARKLYSDLLKGENHTQTKYETNTRLLVAQLEQSQSRVNEEAKQKGKILLQLAECKKTVQNVNTVVEAIKYLISLFKRKK